MYAGIVFFAQLVCCICFKDKLKRYLPTLIALFFISTTVLRANLGELDPQRLLNQTIVSLVGIGSAVTYHAVIAVWNIVSKRSDPAQKLRK
jgi:uncharacterized membrane-anchored protein